MFVIVEPAELFMHRVKLIFDLESPDSEDVEAREYLEEHELEPRHLFDDELEGHKCQVMQFGGCYLGRHLDHLAQIQRKAVEVEVLISEIQGHLANLQLPEGGLSTEDVESTARALVPQFHVESSFQAGESGELEAVLDADAVAAAAREFITANRTQG